jgi:hypothetical protein
MTDTQHVTIASMLAMNSATFLPTLAVFERVDRADRGHRERDRLCASRQRRKSWETYYYTLCSGRLRSRVRQTAGSDRA